MIITKTNGECQGFLLLRLFALPLARQKMIPSGLPHPALHPGPAIYQVMNLDTVLLNGSLMELAIVCVLNNYDEFEKSSESPYCDERRDEAIS
jgi:hypothetical protein